MEGDGPQDMDQITGMCEDMKKAVDCFGELDGPCSEVSEQHAAQAQQEMQKLRQMYDITCATLGKENAEDSEKVQLKGLKRSSPPRNCSGWGWFRCTFFKGSRSSRSGSR